MKRFVSQITHMGARRLLAMALMMLVGWCSATQYFGLTPEGKQCATAPVQTVSVPVKSHCGHVVGYEKRQPQPGEAGFHQCRCAENRLSQVRDGLLASMSFALIGESPAELILPLPLPQVKIADTLASRLVSEPGRPEVRPPAVA